MTVAEQIRRDEGLRLDPYPDFVGNVDRDTIRALWKAFLEAGGTVAIGYGRNLSLRRLSFAEARMLLDNDLASVEAELRERLPWIANIGEARCAALINLSYNMGVENLIKKNPKMLAAARRGDWAEAARELLDGPYEAQVGARARRIARQLEYGEWV